MLLSVGKFDPYYYKVSQVLLLLVGTGLLAIHGNDEAGIFIRSNLRRLGVSLKYITG